MKTDLYHLVYISSAIKDLKHSQLQDLVNTSCEKNKKHNITGLLIYVENNFLQVLEGSRKDVLELFENIQNDARHTSIIKLVSEAIDKRIFGDWSMALRIIGAKELQARCNNLSLLEITDINEELAREKAYILIRSFLKNTYVR